MTNYCLSICFKDKCESVNFLNEINHFTPITYINKRKNLKSDPYFSATGSCLMSGTHIFIGGLHPACRKSDVERFFAGYGRIKTLLLKRGYGFVEFGDSQDASDAVDILDGSELLGSKVTVAHAFPRQFRRYPSYGVRGEQTRSGTLGFSKTTPMKRGAGYKVIVKNLSNRVKWQELKDFMRQAGEVAFADVYEELNEGIVEFRYYPDLKRAVEALDNSVLGGWRIRLIDKAKYEGSSSQNGKSRRINRCISRSRSRSPMKSRKRSNK